MAGTLRDVPDLRRPEKLELLRASEARFETEAAALARLNAASSRLWRTRTLSEGLDEMLAATIALLGADMGNIQLLDRDRAVLVIAAQRGFGPDFLDFFREVRAADGAACGRALALGQRVVVEDVETDALSAPLRAITRAAGYRAVQSTPLIGRDGLLGMISTHFRAPHRPSEPELQSLDLYARQAADFVERLRTEERLRVAAEAVVVAEERERRRLAADLHDDVSQVLSLAGMKLGRLREAAAEQDFAAPLLELSELLARARERTESLTFQLRPPILDDLGLPPAAEWLAEEMQRHYGLRVCVACSGESVLDERMRVSLFRALRELLINVARHAETHEARVALCQNGHTLMLTVEDDGVGFDPARIRAGFGLLSIRERIEMLRGRLDIDTKVGHGTRVRVVVPVADSTPG